MTDAAPGGADAYALAGGTDDATVGIDPALLCDQHLTGEHAEMHQEAGTLLNHPHGEAIVRGHAEEGQIDTSRIRERHDDLAAEMVSRGMSHDSPLSYEDEHDLGEIDREANRADLAGRCADCRARIEASGDPRGPPGDGEEKLH